MTNVINRHLFRDLFLIILGSFIYAIGVDCFQIPFGIAAGGVTGLAVVIHAVFLNMGIDIPVGIQTIVFNVLLMIPVLKSGGLRYVLRVCLGIFASGFFLDLCAPFVPTFEGYDLFVAVLWGGAISGLGVGIVFRGGGNTGGVDIIASFLSKKFHLSLGTVSITVNALVIASSIPVFGLRNALYAVVCMIVVGMVIDAVVDGPRNERACFIVSKHHKEIAEQIMYDLGRGCTELSARGVWSGNARPMLFVILGRTEIGMLKTMVASIDPDAVVAITEIHEAFGQGFRQFDQVVK